MNREGREAQNLLKARSRRIEGLVFVFVLVQLPAAGFRGLRG
jgi:hypothetical protein